MSFPVMLLLMIAGCIGAFFAPFVTLVIGILGIFFVDVYAPTSGDYDFGQIIPVGMSFVVIVASLMSLAFHFVG